MSIHLLHRRPVRYFSAVFTGLLLTTAVLSGCTSAPPGVPIISQLFTSEEIYGTRELREIGEITAEAAKKMFAQIESNEYPPIPKKRHLILPASFVDNKNLEKPSAMGRLVAQQMASHFTEAGYSVVEIKLRRNVLLTRGDDEGQFLLSRELKKVAASQNATTVLVGSYITTRSHMYVNSQLVLLNGGIILASQNFRIPLTYETRDLLIPGT